MRIGIVYHGVYPWNRGIFLVASALHSDGHQVTIICKRAAEERGVEQTAYAEILRFPYLAHFPWLNRSLSIHWGINPLWVWWIWRTGLQKAWDILWVRDLPLMASCLIAGRLLKMPVIFDMRENYPAALEVSGKQNLVHYLVRNRRLVQLLEDYAVRQASHICVVIDEQRERLIARGVPPKKITTNVTTPHEGFLAGASNRRTRHPSEPLRLVYSGFLYEFRGLSLVVEALALVRYAGVNVDLTIIGGGPDGDTTIEVSLRQRADILGVSDRVHLAGWLSPEQLPKFLGSFDIGIIANELSDHTNTTIPGKLFEYMACALPVVSSALIPVKRILLQEQCGRVFEPYTATALANLLIWLAKLDPEDLSRMGLRGRWAVERRYNWRIQSQELLRVVQRIGLR